MSGRQPPRLLVKTLTVTFVTVALLLVAVFIVVMVSVRQQVRQAVVDNLESSQRLFAAVETRRQRELRAQAETSRKTRPSRPRSTPTLQKRKTIDDDGTAPAAQHDRHRARQGGGSSGRRRRARAGGCARRPCSPPPGRLADLWPAGPAGSTGARRSRPIGTTASRRCPAGAFRVVTVPLSHQRRANRCAVL